MVIREMIDLDPGRRSQDAIAAAAGIPRTTMTGPLYGKQRWMLETLRVTAEALGVSAAWVLTRAGYGAAPSVVDMIMGDDRLDPDGKIEVRDLYLHYITRRPEAEGS